MQVPIDEVASAQFAVSFFDLDEAPSINMADGFRAHYSLSTFSDEDYVVDIHGQKLRPHFHQLRSQLRVPPDLTIRGFPPQLGSYALESALKDPYFNISTHQWTITKPSPGPQPHSRIGQISCKHAATSWPHMGDPSMQEISTLLLLGSRASFTPSLSQTMATLLASFPVCATLRTRTTSTNPKFRALSVLGINQT
jgi:hypothetical protein